MKKIDFHVHISDPIPLEKTAEYFRELCARKGYTGVCMLAYTHVANEQIRSAINASPLSQVKKEKKSVE